MISIAARQSHKVGRWIQLFAAAFFLSAQRLFIASDSRFRPAAVRPPRFLGAAATLAPALFEVPANCALRAAQRAFIAAASRRLPAGVMPPERLGGIALRPGRAVNPAPSSRALMALAIRSRSLFRSATILSRFNFGLLCGPWPCLPYLSSRNQNRFHLGCKADIGPRTEAATQSKLYVSVQSPGSRANTTKPLAGITIALDALKPCSGPPDATIAPPLPATIGLTQLS